MDIILADEEHARFVKTKTFRSLDRLRAIAILTVVWHRSGVVVPGWQITRISRDSI